MFTWPFASLDPTIPLGRSGPSPVFFLARGRHRSTCIIYAYYNLNVLILLVIWLLFCGTVCRHNTKNTFGLFILQVWKRLSWKARRRTLVTYISLLMFSGINVVSLFLCFLCGYAIEMWGLQRGNESQKRAGWPYRCWVWSWFHYFLQWFVLVLLG